MLLSWGIRRGCSVIPKSVTASRIISNFQVIELENEDFNAIEHLANTIQPKRLVDPSPFWGVDIYGSSKSKL